MNQDLLQQLSRLRNEPAHGQQRSDAASLGKRLQELGVSVPVADMQWFVADLLRGFGRTGERFVPPVLLSVIQALLRGRSADIACDPWAGFGVLAATVQDTVRPRKTFACTPNSQDVALARVLTPELDWHAGEPLAFLGTLEDPVDVIASVLPFGLKTSQAVDLRGESGEIVRCSGDLGSLLLAAASMQLSPSGIGLFVVATRFFFTPQSVLRDFPRLGLGVEAALAAPAGSFAPVTNIATSLVVVRKQRSTRMFVAQLSQDTHTNRQILVNLREGRGDGPLEFGRFVVPGEFRSLDSLRLAEQLRQAEDRFHVSAMRLGDLALEICRGRPGDDFSFPVADNAFYIPLIGISNVVDSSEAMTLKRHNYAQVVVDRTRSDARFVARFLNSDLGRAIREANKSGTTIPKLNTSGIKELPIFVPHLTTQEKILDTAGKLVAQKNTILGLQNELDLLHRELWNTPGKCDDISSRLHVFASRLSQGAAPHASATLDQWFETLPFPLASILRAWQATASQDFKTKYEHLLHFFEAAAEFIGIIYLSAFASRPEVFADHRERLWEAWKRQNLSLERASFGTWKVVVEYLSNQTRRLLSGDAEKRSLCAELFVDQTLALPEMLAQSKLAEALSAAIKMRNDWIGHGGVVSQPEAQLRDGILQTQLENLRRLMADGWHRVRLLRCLQCQPRQGVFENEVAILVGSNSEFLKETRSMSSWLDVERLYLASDDSGRGLLILPFILVDLPPASVKSACYFFNRVEKDCARFISYHFVDQPELKLPRANIADAMRFLTNGSVGDDH